MTLVEVIKLPVSLAQKLCEFAHCYDLSHRTWMRQIGLTKSERELISDAYDAMIFYTAYIHERQGSNPRFPLYHREALREAMNGREFDDVLLSDISFPDRVWNYFLSFARPKPNKKITKGVVFQILNKMRDEHQPNLISLLRTKSLLEAYEWLKGVRGIGPKLASLFLRDIWSFIGSWENTPEENKFCLQPVDRWILFWAGKCWPDDDWASKEIKLESVSVKIRFAKNLTSKCLSSRIDPISFNKGAWFAGSHFEEIARFLNISEKRQVRMSKCVLDFNSQKVLEGIEKFNECDRRQNIFPV